MPPQVQKDDWDDTQSQPKADSRFEWGDESSQSSQPTDHISQPPGFLSRFRQGAEAGMGGENALNSKVDPQHPISTNPMIPGAGVYRDIKGGNYAGALGRIAGPAAAIGAMFVGGAKGIDTPSPAPSLLREAIAADALPRMPMSSPMGETESAIETARPQAEQHLRNAIQADTPKPMSQQRRIGDLLNDSLGGKPLEPKTPLRNQGNRITSDIAQTPTGTPTESSVIKSYKYDPAKREFQATTTGGATYIHGDVSPEQAKAFEQAPSKGTAWKELKDNSTYVGKVVNGQRVNVKPPISSRSADPNDLTQLLEDSLSQVNKKKLGK